jgi:hypothetical protein
MLKLYGNVDAIEPSLLPSASRDGISIDEYMSAWFALLDIHLDEYKKNLGRGMSAAAYHELDLDMSAFRINYNFRLWAFGLAQHYGLPSTGLDLTPEIDVALFFALHDFTMNDQGKATISRIEASKSPVIFLMGVFKQDVISDSGMGLKELATPRAQAQNANFFWTGWGGSPNRAAERIIAILDLEDHTKWDIPELKKQLFPSNHKDHYSKYLSEAPRRFPKLLNTIPLEKIYYTEEE